MKSLESATPGIISRARLIKSKYTSRVYPRRMRSKVEVDPLCAGMCNCLQTFGVRAMTRNKSSGKSFGCGDVNRTRTSRSKPATAAMRSANVRAPSRFGLYTDLNPFAYAANGSSSVDVVAFIGASAYEFTF